MSSEQELINGTSEPLPNYTPGRVLELLPHEIEVDQSVLKARPLYDLGEEQKEIQALADSMEREGQLQPIVIRDSNIFSDGNRYHLVAGRRRLDAAYLINSMRPKGAEPFKIKAIVQDIEPYDALRAAIAENLKRKNLSPIQFSLVVKLIREEYGWQGGKNTRKVAEFMQVSAATVTQAEKLLSLPGELQKQIHNGELTAKSAWELLDVKPDKRKEVIEKGRELEDREAVGDIAADMAGYVAGEHDELPVKKGKKKPIKSRNIRKAAREVEGATEKVKPRTRKDIVEFFESLNGPAYGFGDGAVILFLTYFEKWCQGYGTDRTLMAKFDKMVDKADRGTKSAPGPEQKAAPKTKKAAKHK